MYILINFPQTSGDRLLLLPTSRRSTKRTLQGLRGLDVRSDPLATV